MWSSAPWAPVSQGTVASGPFVKQNQGLCAQDTVCLGRDRAEKVRPGPVRWGHWGHPSVSSSSQAFVSTLPSPTLPQEAGLYVLSMSPLPGSLLQQRPPCLTPPLLLLKRPLWPLNTEVAGPQAAYVLTVSDTPSCSACGLWADERALRPPALLTPLPGRLPRSLKTLVRGSVSCPLAATAPACPNWAPSLLSQLQ